MPSHPEPAQHIESPDAMATLRGKLRAVELRAHHGILAFGDPRVDACLLHGGLRLGQLHETAAEGLEAETAAVTAGFVCCLLARMAREHGHAMRPAF